MLSIRKLYANWQHLEQRCGTMIGIALIQKAFRS